MAEVVLLNIGNTHTQVALGCDAVVNVVQQLPTADFLESGACVELLDKPGGRGCLAACVVPAASELLLRRYGESQVQFLQASMIKEIDFSLVDVSTMGADRFGNAAAAVELGKLPAIVLDCGTAVTTEAIDADCRFRGGAIMPGRAMLRRSLHENAAMLPYVDIQNQCPAPLGRNTRDAILAGVDLGIIGAVEKLLSASRAVLGALECPVIAVGGDASFFLDNVSGLIAGPDDFTLRGVNRVARSLF